MKTIILTRTSHNKKGLDMQLDQVRNYCRAKRMEIIKTIKFVGTSSSIPSQLSNDLVSIIESSNQRVALCTNGLDRFYRGSSEFTSHLLNLVSKGKLEIHFVSNNSILNSESVKSSFDVLTVLTQYDPIRNNDKYYTNRL
jgi:DNA invertase Pin-like site-specific DNA recombinase